MKTPPRKLLDLVSKHPGLSIIGNKRGYVVANASGETVEVNMGQLSTYIQWNELAVKMSRLAGKK